MYEYCEACGDDTLHIKVDMGFGWTERGSHGADHSQIVFECSQCGALKNE